MTIDWTKPVCDHDEPYRTYTVLTTNRPVDIRPVVAMRDDDGTIWTFSLEGEGNHNSWVNGQSYYKKLMNVPEKPKIYEAWVNLYADGDVSLLMSKDDADYVALTSRVECRHIVWNSDGSPVYGMVSKEEYDRVCAELAALKQECSYWNLKAEKAAELLAKNDVVKSCETCAKFNPVYPTNDERLVSLIAHVIDDRHDKLYWHECVETARAVLDALKGS